MKTHVGVYAHYSYSDSPSLKTLLPNLSSSESSLECTRLIKTKALEARSLDPDDRLSVDRFLEWLKDRKEWWVLLERENVEGVRYYKRDFRFFRVYNRFDKAYVKKVIRKFERVKFFAEDHSFVHFVFTVERKMSIRESIKALRVNWNRLRALLKKKLGKNYPFVAVLEPHKDGYPHMHVLLFTNKFVFDHEKLSEWCKKHNLGYVVWLRRYWANGCRKKPIYYLTKYLTKQYRKESWSVGDFVFYACIWFLRAKTYSFNHNIRFGAKSKLSGDWDVMVLSYESLIRVIKIHVEMGLWCFEYPLEYSSMTAKERLRWWFS